MEATDPILGNPLFVAALLLFLIILPLALRQKKKTSLDKIIARMEAEELKEAAKEEAAQEKAGKEKTAEDTDEPSPAVKEPPATPQETSPVLKKEKKLVKEGVPISHNEETAGLHKAGSGSTASSQGKKSSWDEDFSIASHEDSGNNWVEAEIPGLIIEPFPAEKDSDTEPKAHGPAPAEKESPDKPKPKEILTFKAAPKSTHIFGEDEFEDLHTKEKLPSKVKDPAEKAVEKKSPDKPKPKEIRTFKAAPKSTHKFG